LGVNEERRRGRARPEGTKKERLQGVVIIYSVREEREEKRSKLLYKCTIAPRSDTRRGIIHDPYPPLQA
jgi:hypothetical protein